MRADRCVSEVPVLEAVAEGHRAACHFRDRVVDLGFGRGPMKHSRRRPHHRLDRPPRPRGRGGNRPAARILRKCNAAGLPIARALVIIDTLHPVHEGTVFRWRNDDVEEKAATAVWPHHRRRGGRNPGSAARSITCCRPAARNCAGASAFGEPADFPSHPGDEGAEATPTTSSSSTASPRTPRSARWTASTRAGRRDAPDGFSEADIAALRRLVPRLRSPIKMRLAGAHRRHAGRGLSRPRRRPARAERPHRARRGRAHRARCCGSPTCAATPRITDTAPPERDHPAAQRLCRGGDHRRSTRPAATC